MPRSQTRDLPLHRVEDGPSVLHPGRVQLGEKTYQYLMLE
jgi:hypothetical protein